MRRLSKCAGIGAVAVLLAACSGGAATISPAAPIAATPTTGASAPSSATPAPATPSSSASAPGSAECSAGSPEAGGYKSFNCTVDAPSLANNKLGDPAKLKTMVLLPGSYEGSSKRYPVVYMLAGYTEPVGSIDSALYTGLNDAGTKPELIVVLVEGLNAFGGSFYVNSAVTGNWDDAITKDLVAYVDGHYRTLADSKSRGIAGSSMGGFGALNLAMLHPDVFGAVYAMSPGLFDQKGAEDRLGMEDVVADVLDFQKQASGPADPAKVVAESKTGGEGLQFEYAYGAAFAPDPASPILMRFPYRLDGTKAVRDAALWKTWDAGFGGLTDKIAKHGANLKALRGIAIDYGTSDYYDWIPKGSAYLVKLLQDAKITVTANVHDGGHTDRLPERMAQFMLPFMAGKLAAG